MFPANLDASVCISAVDLSVVVFIFIARLAKRSGCQLTKPFYQVDWTSCTKLWLNSLGNPEEGLGQLVTRSFC